MSSPIIFRDAAVRQTRQEACLWGIGDTNVASRLLTARIERAHFTPAQHDEPQPQTAIMRSDAKAPANPASHFMGYPLPLNGRRYYSALWQEFENFRSLSDHSRAANR
jgi:hypothetical protein